MLKTDYNAKIIEIEGKTLRLVVQLLLLYYLQLKIKYLVLIVQSNETEKKITNHDHNKYTTIPEFNKLTAEYFVARLAQTNLASKSDVANFLNKTDFDDRLIYF